MTFSLSVWMTFSLMQQIQSSHVQLTYFFDREQSRQRPVLPAGSDHFDPSCNNDNTCKNAPFGKHSFVTVKQGPTLRESNLQRPFARHWLVHANATCTPTDNSTDTKADGSPS
eukprot:m.125119 g.125119  ORF g.125119 m.125119 type:complete len:113 (-) comp17315_c0_seq9:66-404(-)